MEFTFKRQRGEQERRVYAFDTIPDQRVGSIMENPDEICFSIKDFLEEIERHLEPSTPIDLELTSPTFLDVCPALDTKTSIVYLHCF